MRIIVFFFISCVCFYSCLSPDNNKDKLLVDGKKEDVEALMADSVVGKTQDLSIDVICDLLQTIPRPIEILDVSEKAGSLYSPKMLNDPENYSNYKTSFRQALNLGIYQSDFVYLNLNNDRSSVLKFLDKVGMISRDLKLGEFFDNKVIVRIKENIEKPDSLLFITDQSFKKINTYLKLKERTNISILIAYGAWIESMYLSTRLTKITNKSILYRRIGEQQVALDNIIFLISIFSKDKNFEALLSDLNDLRSLYDNVTISYNYSKPTIKEVNGVLQIIDNSQSEVILTDRVFEDITKQVEKIRNKIVA